MCNKYLGTSEKACVLRTVTKMLFRFKFKLLRAIIFSHCTALALN